MHQPMCFGRSMCTISILQGFTPWNNLYLPWWIYWIAWNRMSASWVIEMTLNKYIKYLHDQWINVSKRMSLLYHSYYTIENNERIFSSCNKMSFRCWNSIRYCYFFSARRPECLSDPECPNHLACIQEKCQDPCTSQTCGVNAECRVNNHRAVCTCRPNYTGDPFKVCYERKVLEKDMLALS